MKTFEEIYEVAKKIRDYENAGALDPAYEELAKWLFDKFWDQFEISQINRLMRIWKPEDVTIDAYVLLIMFTFPARRFLPIRSQIVDDLEQKMIDEEATEEERNNIMHFLKYSHIKKESWTSDM